MSATEWIHCNKCMLRFGNNNSFFLTECGHILCQNCSNKTGQSGICIICQSRTKTVALSNQLNPEMLAYFKPLSNSLEDALKVVKFQTKNIFSLLKSLVSKYNYAKTELMKYIKMSQELKKENEKLKCLLRGIPQRVSSTPMSQSSGNLANITMSSIHNSPFDNSSKLSGMHRQGMFGNRMINKNSDFNQSNHVVPVHGSRVLGPMSSMTKLRPNAAGASFGYK